jgi:hypothetical protein
VRHLDWEKHRSFLDFASTGEGEGGGGQGEGGGVEEREEAVSRAFAEDAWLQSLRG